jgi:hypothetical protein
MKQGLFMQTLHGLRFLVAVLFLISAIFHFIVAYSLFATEFAPSIIDFVFGVIYAFLGIGLFFGKRLFFYFCLIFALIDGVGGVSAHIASQAIAPLIAASIDLVIIILCIYLLIKKDKNGKQFHV